MFERTNYQHTRLTRLHSFGWSPAPIICTLAGHAGSNGVELTGLPGPEGCFSDTGRGHGVQRRRHGTPTDGKSESGGPESEFRFGDYVTFSRRESTPPTCRSRRKEKSRDPQSVQR